MNKKGDINWILVTLLLGIMVAGVVIGKFAMTSVTFQDFFSKFKKSGGETSNDFLFSAKSIKIADNSCTAAGENKYDCKPENVDFIVTVENQNTMLRELYGAIVLCPSECDDDGECKVDRNDECMDVIIKSPQDCSLKPGEAAECPIVSQFLDPGTYRVYAAAVCKLDAKTGCSSSNEILEKEPSSINSKYFIDITVN